MPFPKPEPKLFTLLCVAANSIILISCPYNKNDIKACCGVIKEF